MEVDAGRTAAAADVARLAGQVSELQDDVEALRAEVVEREQAVAAERHAAREAGISVMQQVGRRLGWVGRHGHGRHLLATYSLCASVGQS